jgi:hypothetical protein
MATHMAIVPCNSIFGPKDQLGDINNNQQTGMSLVNGVSHCWAGCYRSVSTITTDFIIAISINLFNTNAIKKLFYMNMLRKL